MKLKLIIAMIFIGCFMTACSTEIPINDKDTDVVAEYMGELLLRYGCDEPGKLIYEEPSTEPVMTNQPVATQSPVASPTVTNSATPGATVTPTPTATVTPTNSPVASSSANPSDTGKLTANTTAVSLNDIYGFNNVFMSLKESKEHTAYPKDSSVFSMTAKNGYKFLFVTFTAENKGDKAVDLDLMKKKVTYHLNVNGKWYTSLTTILENDAQFFNKKLASGKKTDFIVAFELKEKIDIKDAKLVLLQDTNSCELDLD